MYTKERTHLLELFEVRSNLRIKDGPVVTMPNEILGDFPTIQWPRTVGTINIAIGYVTLERASVLES